MQPAYAPFRHNVDGADHARAFRVTDAGAGNISVAAGRVRIDQTVTDFPGATALGPLAVGVNFIYISNLAVITALLAGPYPANSIPLARVTVGVGPIVTAIADDRCFFYEDTAAGAGGNTLDQAYDQGGAGAGRTINATDGAVLITNADLDAGVPNLELARAVAYVAEPHLGIRATGDAAYRFTVDGNGRMRWGSGAGAADVVLSRAAANHLALAAGDRFRVPYIADTAGTDRIALAAASPHVKTTGNTQLGTASSNSGTGINCLPAVGTALRISPALSTAAAWYGIQMFPAITSTANNQIMTAIWGQASVVASAGIVGTIIRGLNFQAGLVDALGRVHAVAEITGLLVGASVVSFAGGANLTVADMWGAKIQVAIGQIAGTITVTNAVCAWLNSPNSNRLTNYTGLEIVDETAATGNIYLMEVGPAVPYLRCLGGMAAVLNQTALYIAHGNAGPAWGLRQLWTMDPGAGGANFAGGELVCILV